MARIPDAELMRLKAEVAVACLVEGCGVELRPQGQDLVGRCPNPGFENKINSISPTHIYYNDAVEWGEAWLRGNGF